MKLKYFLPLIRYKNVLMVVFMIILFSFTLTGNNSATYFTTFLLIISVSSITIAGNIINDYYDIEIDKINKPNKLIVSKYISKEKALLLYFYFTFFGIISSIYLSTIIGHFQVLYIVLFTSVLLFLYSKYLKKYAVIGNLVVSFLVGLSVFIIPLSILKDQSFVIYIGILFYSFFAFFINFIRELVKDIEDLNGDYANRLKTLPILIGKKRTQYFVAVLSTIFTVLIIYFISKFKEDTILNIYLLLTIVLPLIYFTYKIVIAKSKREFHKLSTLLKIIMFFGLLSVLIIHYS